MSQIKKGSQLLKKAYMLQILIAYSSKSSGGQKSL